MKYLYQLKNNQLNGVLCPCGEIHSALYPMVVYTDLLQAISRVLVSGHLLCLRDEDIDGRVFDAIKKNGSYRISEDSILPYQTSYIEDIEEDVRLVVAVGGATLINISKRIAYEINAKLVVLPIYAYKDCIDSTSRVLRDGRLDKQRGRVPDMIVVDYDVIALSGVEYLRGAYGGLAGDISILNDYIYRGMREGSYCPHIVKAVRSALIPSIKVDRLNIGMSAQLVDTSLRVSMLMSMLPSQDSGAIQLVDTLYAYLAGKTSDVRLYGENITYTSSIVGKLYESYLRGGELKLTIPPNRGEDAEKMRRLLGVEEHKALLVARRYEGDIDKASYIMNIIRPKLYLEIQVNNIMIGLIRRVLFDSYEDKGYFMRHYIGTREMFKLLALAPEYMRGDTMLTYIKDTGILEKLG